MIEEVLSRASGVAEAAEVYQVNSRETPVNFETNRLKQIVSRQSRSISLRLIRRGRLGFATAAGQVDAADLVRRAVEVSEFGAPAHFQMPAAYGHPPVQVYDPRTEALPEDNLVELGQGLIDALCRHTPEIRCDARVMKGAAEVNIANSKGAVAQYKKTTFYLGVEGTIIRGMDMLFVGDGELSTSPVAHHQPLAQLVISQLEMAKTNAVAPSGVLPAVFTPRGVASAFHFPLMMAFNGRVVFQGASPLGHRKGEKVFQDNISLWDDASIPFRPASRPWDDEGVPSQRTPLIERGVVSNFLYDLQTAGLAKTRSTGNASRAMGGMPAPAPSALVVAPGEASVEDMLRDMEEGLLIDHLMGAEQGNVLGGDFSGNVLLGYRVEKGRVVGRVKDTMVAGNVYELLREGVVLGKEPRWIYGQLFTPHIFVPRLSVATKG